MENKSANIKITTFSCPTSSSCRYDKKVYGCRIYPSDNSDSKACIEYHQLELLRNGFEDNISETDMLGIVDHNGKPVFWGTFDELIEKLTKY